MKQKDIHFSIQKGIILPVFILILCMPFVHAIATEPISITYNFEKSSYTVGEQVKVNYKITGGSSVFDYIAYDCYAYDNGALVSIKSDTLSSSIGTITYTPTIGQRTFVTMHGFDSENRFFECDSNEIQLSGGITAEPISISYTFDKPSYAVGSQIKVNYKISGGSGFFTRTTYYCYAYDNGALVSIKNDTVSSSTGTITYTPTIGQKTFVTMHGFDSENRFFECDSDEIPLLGGTAADPISISYTFDKSSYAIGSQVKVSYKIAGGSGIFNRTTYYCYAYDDGALVSIKNGIVSTSTGTITYTPNIGQETFITMFGFDSEDRYFNSDSKKIPLKCSPNNHHIVIDAAKSPTKTSSGLTEGKHCLVCNEVLVAQRVIPALNKMNVLYLPTSLEKIENWAFSNSSCQAVIIPDSCSSIGEHAFERCSNLIYVRIPASIGNYPANAFSNCNEGLYIDKAK